MTVNVSMSGKDDVDETFSIVAGASSQRPEQAGRLFSLVALLSESHVASAAGRSYENVTGSEANQATRDQFVQKLFKIDPQDYQNFSTEKKIRLVRENDMIVWLLMFGSLSRRGWLVPLLTSKLFK